ncbi:hypothetical protein Back2_11020 [Nocardioides baekrokdamisoli]|uniref:ATP-grasp domain-containing protein n=1 Tax=Nocardioides baekrokdamisoli TaxID=1804624 RepID=A0A3G9ILB9_9ACTN|nr:hypothetical protein [Nocardioides baekrokdamisoli]BBH16815.1 hypothetical protein Back2_11020 [Nocardioides baekrokdamisoli]
MHLTLIQPAGNRLPDAVLKRLAGHRCSVITEPHHEQQYPADIRCITVWSLHDIAAVTEAYERILRTGPVDAIVALFEIGQPAAGHLRSRYGLPGTSYDVANRFSNKLLTKRAYASAGLPTAHAHLAPSPEDVATVAEGMGWPVIVKPTLGGGAVQVFEVAGPDDLARRLSTSGPLGLKSVDVPLIVEPFLTVLDEFHCDSVVIDGTVVFSAASQYLAPLLNCPVAQNGSFLLPDSSELAAQIGRLNEAAVAALGLRDGVTHIELFRTPDGLVLGEAACRPAGGGIPDAIRLAYGVDLWDLMMRLTLGESVEVSATTPESVGVNYHLPVQPGRIKALSSASDLAALPGVMEVDMHHRVGDRIPDTVNSSYTTGVVHLAVPDVASVPSAITEVLDHYVLDVRPRPWVSRSLRRLAHRLLHLLPRPRRTPLLEPAILGPGTPDGPISASAS